MNLVDDVLVQYQPLVKKQLQGLGINHDHDEYFQIGMIALWEAYTRFDPEKGKFSTFAIATVRGRLLSTLRKEQTFRQRHLVNDEPLLEIADPNSVLPFEIDMLQPYLSQLTPREQVWVFEVIILGRTTSEIAQLYHVSPHTVRSWKKGVSRKLRNALDFSII